MKTQKYIVTIEMPDGNMISSEWLKDLIESDCCIEEEDEGRFSISVEEISTSEDLEKAAEEYEKEHTYQRYDGGGLTPEYDATLAEAFIAGAKWQEKHSKDGTEEK